MGAPSLPVSAAGSLGRAVVFGAGLLFAGRRVFSAGLVSLLAARGLTGAGFAGAGSGLTETGSGVAGTGSLATTRSRLRPPTDNTRPITTTETIRRTHILVSLPIQRAAEVTHHAWQTDQGTEKEEDKSRVTVGTPWHERGETGRGERPSIRQRNRRAFIGPASKRGTGGPLLFPARRMVEAPGVEPGSEDRPHNGSTCVADRFNFAATHAHRLA